MNSEKKLCRQILALAAFLLVTDILAAQVPSPGAAGSE